MKASKRIVLVDNYDSFTYNLVQYFQELGCEVKVFRNDEISEKDIRTLKPDGVVFSPGPGTVECPKDIGAGEEIFWECYQRIPILGVCLGHQMIGKLFGGSIKRVTPQHGKRWKLRVTYAGGLFRDFPSHFIGMRYHSMVVEFPEGLPEGWHISARTDDEASLIMALEHPEDRVFGVQFHPESIGTPLGMKILRNFLSFFS